MNAEIRVNKAQPVQTEITVPGDKSISHRAVLFASLSNGTCTIRNYLEGEDCLRTIDAMKACGVEVERPSAGVVVVHGRRGDFLAPGEDIYCGNSGTSMRLLCGLLAGQPFKSRLTGDPSLSSRPMRRVMEPLEKMGASLSAEGTGGRPPLLIQGGSLQGVRYELPVASAQVKSAILLAGLFAQGKTTVVEPVATRDHTERMLQYFLVPVRKVGNAITILGGQKLESRDIDVPGDISSAAFWLVAAAASPGTRLLIKNVGLNPTRTGILDVLIRMGARIREVVEMVDGVEPAGVLDIKGGALRGTVIQGREIPNVIDELPVLAVAAALAEGRTEIRDAAELRVKESDRIAAVAGNLRAMGALVQEKPDGMIIEGPADLRGARLQSFGDHRIAMAFAIAGLFAKGETVIEDTSCVATSYPGFEQTLARFFKNPKASRQKAAV